jgi:hypothetical protein
MAKNEINTHYGLHRSFTKATKSSGDPVLIGDQGLHGVCLTDTGADGKAVVDLGPGVVYDIPVKGHNGTIDTAVDIGDKVYYTDGEAFLDVDPAATFFGYALEAVSSGATTTVNVFVVAH